MTIEVRWGLMEPDEKMIDGAGGGLTVVSGLNFIEHGKGGKA